MVHSSAAEGYSRHSATYAQARPSYHPMVLRRLAARLNSDPWLELGAGTGIATRAFLEQGRRVIAVEPVAAMRSKLREATPGVEAIAARADAIPVADSSMAVVLAAQAFHWFDHSPTLDELVRVLGAGGALVTLWNVRDYEVPWMVDWTEIVDTYAGDTPRDRTKIWRRAIESDGRFTLADEIGVPNPQPSSPDAVVARALSTSFIAALDAAAQADVERRLRRLVEPMGERFDFPYLTQAQL